MVLKISSKGNLLWTKLIASTTESTTCFNLIEVGGFIYVGGRTEGFGISNAIDIVVSKLTSNGEV